MMEETGWLLKDQEGLTMQREITKSIQVLGHVGACLCVIYTGALIWMAFEPQIKTCLLFVQSFFC